MVSRSHYGVQLSVLTENKRLGYNLFNFLVLKIQNTTQVINIIASEDCITTKEQSSWVRFFGRIRIQILRYQKRISNSLNPF